MASRVIPQLIDGRALRTAYGHFPTGVVAVCAQVDGELVGMAVSAFMPISLEPPLIAICIQSSSSTWPKLRRAGGLGVSILSRDQHVVAKQLAAKGRDRFTGLDHVTSSSGAVLIGGAQVGFNCSIHNIAEAGDHELVMLKVEDVANGRGTEDPMVFHASRFAGLRHPPGRTVEPLEIHLW